MISNTNSLRGFALLALGCGLLAPAGAQLVPVVAFGGSGATATTQFGFSIGLSTDGTVAIVGGPGFNSSGGGAWISRRTGSNWAPGTLLPAGTSASGAGQQGYAVGISGDGHTTIVGAPFDTAGGANAGAFWIYTSSGGAFSQVLHNQSGAAGVQLGYSAALSSDGNTVIAGGPGGNLAIAYTRSGASLNVDAVLSAPGTSGFGTAVALSADGNTALVGAPNSNGNTGGAWVFTRTGSTWSAGTLLPLGTPAISAGRQGMAVSLSGNGQRAVVGGFSTSLSGAAWVYNLSNGVWTQEAQLAFAATSGTDGQGNAVALSADGTYALMGIYNYLTGQGAVVEFQRTVNPSTQQVTWPFQGGAQGNAAGWNCGSAVAIATVAASTGLYGCVGVNEVASLGTSDLAITNAHNGTFSRGASGSYTIHVSNVGQLATFGTTTVKDTLPAGLAYTGFSPSAWGCTAAAANSVTTVTCNNSASINPGAAFADLTVNVNVSGNAPVVLSTTATVSGGGEINTANDSATDLVQLPPAPDLAITKSHSGALYKGRTGVPYTLTVINVAASASTNGQVAVLDNFPTGLTNAGNISAPGGWDCSGSTGVAVACLTSNALTAGTAYKITFTADVSRNSPATINNTATVSGGGEINTANNAASDLAKVGATGPDLTISISDSGAVSAPFKVGQTSTYWISITNSGAGSTSGSVLVTDALPSGMTPTAMSGTGWKCTVGTLSCTRNDPLPAGLSYKAIALTVSVTAGVPSPATNTATVSGGGDSVLTNNTAIDTTSIQH